MATTQDAEIILKLYELRREAEMRKARHYITNEFWPESFDGVWTEIGTSGDKYRGILDFMHSITTLCERNAKARELLERAEKQIPVLRQIVAKQKANSEPAATWLSLTDDIVTLHRSKLGERKASLR